MSERIPDQLESALGHRLDDHDLLILLFSELKHYQEDLQDLKQIIREQSIALRDMRDFKFKIAGGIAAIVALFEGAIHYLFHK